MQFRGASLTEVLISLALVSMLFILGTMTWQQLESHQAAARLLEYRIEARQLLDTKTTGASDEKTEFKGVYFIRNAEPFPGNDKLKLLTVTCLGHDAEILFRRSRIIPAENE